MHSSQLADPKPHVVGGDLVGGCRHGVGNAVKVLVNQALGIPLVHHGQIVLEFRLDGAKFDFSIHLIEGSVHHGHIAVDPKAGAEVVSG